MTWIATLLALAPAQGAPPRAGPQSAQTRPATSAADGLHPRLKMETTLGDILLELDAEKTPITAHNFIRYAEEGFYNGTIFHRVISNFMIQGGGFTPEMKQKKQGLHPPIRNEWRHGLKNRRGTIAMARTAEPDSATAQFFINVVDNPRLDRGAPRTGNAGYCAFGRVVAGMDVVDTIRNVKLQKHPRYPAPRAVTPVEPVVIKSVKLLGGYDRQRVAGLLAAAEQAASQAAQRAGAARERELRRFIRQVERESGRRVERTASGLMYLVLKKGDGPSPQAGDTVEVHYTGWLLDGTKFDSSVDRGRPATFPLNRVIKGWSEGVGMMKVGGKRKLIIPPELAYGRRGRPPTIPANSYLVFDVELLAIK